jgi:hypothetical protein
MVPQIGLYYPFIHFKSDSWLKAAALYWDKMGRIVPYGYETRGDSETVRRLADELDFIQNFNPREWCGPLCTRFAELLTRHRAALQARYHVAQRDEWPIDPITTANAPPDAEPGLAYVFGGKMDDLFVDQLVDAGLGVRGRGSDLLWVGMHPRLASVYMTALAAQTADDIDQFQLHPLTDEALDHVALGGWTMARLAQGLLGDEVALPKAGIEEDEVAARLASIAIETVIPKNLDNVDVRKIIRLRKERREELTAFQAWMNSIAASLLAELAQMKNRDALQAHLDVVVARDVTPRLDGFREHLRSVGIEAVRGALNIKVAAPPLLVGALGAAVNPVLGATAGLAVGVFDVVLDARKRANSLAKATPTAYLMHLQEGLRPSNLLTWVSERMRQFALGV